ncbi:glycoside hydrolase family 27 protein [Calocera viscosa TUFC12733]|uniref:alpha-galactosidase n=1 Tax=Calocera viscosa (strain TUFC12733) TaxID=1330018 RepID=A0A167FZ34_CALVF|nr:glycoside hydrolase family 27 protein [Calocera viscosa TUFC12733]
MIYLAPAFLAALFGLAAGLNNQGVARLPVTGYNTWNGYACNISSQVVRETAQSLKDLGLQASTQTCAGYPGSYGYEEQDVATFMSWGLDYLKFDNCNPPPDAILQASIPQKFQRMADAISTVASSFNSTPLIYSLCEWGQSQPWLWGASMAQSWRITGDVTATWSSVVSILNAASFITLSSGFYGHNDLDMVSNGNLTYDEAKSHFTAWALLKSPLLIGTIILLNHEILAINQDPNVAMSISPFAWGLNSAWTYDPVHPAQFWSGQTSNGTVIMLLNTFNQPSTLCFNVTDSPYLAPTRPYIVRDLWSHTNNCTVTGSTDTAMGAMGVFIPPHGVSALLFTDAGNICDITSTPVS